MRGMLEPAVSPAVPGHASGGAPSDRQSRRAPQVAGVQVTQIEDLAGAIADRIVGPGCDLVLATVDRPGVAAAFGRDLKTEVRIGDDIDPGSRREMARLEDGDIFAPAVGEAADAVEELERRVGCHDLLF